jgi:hypothetical protein
VGEWRRARRRALPYENNAHPYRLTVAKLAQSKINMATFSDWVELPRTAFHLYPSACFVALLVNLILWRGVTVSGWPRFGRNQRMSSEIPIEIEDKPTAISIMHELVEHLQDTIEALKREIARNRKNNEYRKALKSTEARLTIAKQILAREEARASHPP